MIFTLLKNSIVDVDALSELEYLKYVFVWIFLKEMSRYPMEEVGFEPTNP